VDAYERETCRERKRERETERHKHTHAHTLNHTRALLRQVNVVTISDCIDVFETEIGGKGGGGNARVAVW